MDKKSEEANFFILKENPKFADIKFAEMKRTYLYHAALSLLLGWCCSCDLIEYSPYDSRYDGEGQLNEKAIAKIEESTRGAKEIRFAVISDTQRWYDETEAAVKSINARGDIQFVVHCGDMTDFGMTREYDWMNRELRKLVPPCVCLIGNHDCLGTGADVYRSMYGNPNFSFDAGDTHFLCLNTNSFEYDYSIAIPDFGFIKQDCASVSGDIRRTIVVMHAAPLSDQFNDNVAEIFNEKLKLFPGLQFCLCGHNHHFAKYEPLNDGVLYYRCGAANKREYLVFTMKKDGSYDFEIVPY